jgi:DNA adenine methylase
MASTTKKNGAPVSSYFGGKGGSGTYQTIINEIRPHHTYIEPFLGGGSIMLHKAKAAKNIGIDLDDKVIQTWIARKEPEIQLSTYCGIKYLEGLAETGVREKTVIYCDPPYPLSSRKSQKEVYRHEMSDKEHQRLLDVLLRLSTNYLVDILLSTYPNELYKEALFESWTLLTYNSTTRQGPATEWLFMNYDNHEGLLHDYSFIGENYRERERIKKKIDRHVARLRELPAPERNAILHAITNSCSTTKNEDTEQGITFDTNFKSKNIYLHETDAYKLRLFIALHHDKDWNWGYDLRLKKGTMTGSIGGAHISHPSQAYPNMQEAIMAAVTFTRSWIVRAIKNNSFLSPKSFSHFYDWYSQQTQLSITEEPGQ